MSLSHFKPCPFSIHFPECTSSFSGVTAPIFSSIHFGTHILCKYTVCTALHHLLLLSCVHHAHPVTSNLSPSHKRDIHLGSLPGFQICLSACLLTISPGQSTRHVKLRLSKTKFSVFSPSILLLTSFSYLNFLEGPYFWQSIL